MNIPQSRIELEKWMNDNCYNFRGYSINGNHIFEGFGIDENGIFEWFYTERGQKRVLEIFKSEKEIVEFAFNQIKEDKMEKLKIKHLHLAGKNNW